MHVFVVSLRQFPEIIIALLINPSLNKKVWGIYDTILRVSKNETSREHHLLLKMRLDLSTKDFMRLSVLECGILRMFAPNSSYSEIFFISRLELGHEVLTSKMKKTMGVTDFV